MTVVGLDVSECSFWLIGLACGALAYAAILLIRPILFPRVITYPWVDGVPQEKNMTVILAGSYNPPHYGHLAMLSYLSNRYGKVIAVIGINPSKKYPVTPHERASLLRKMLQESKNAPTNVRVEVVQGYIWRYAKREGASLFFRGIRSWEKDGGEERGLQILNTWGPLLLGPLYWPIPTVYLEGKPEYNHVSSTLVRGACGASSAELTRLVPASICDDVASLYGKEGS